MRVKSVFKELGADFLLLLVAISWGGTFFIVQDAVEEVPVYLFLFWRFFISAFLILIFSYKRVVKADKKTFLAGGVLGVFMFLGFASQTYALTLTYSSTVAFITGLNVIIVPFTIMVLFGKRASLFSLFGAFCAVVGLYFLTYNESIGFGRGEFYALICAFMFAFHIVYTDIYSKKFDILSIVTIQFFTVALFSLIFAYSFDDKIVPDHISSVFIKALVATVLFATIFAFGVQTAMQKFTTPVKTAIIFTLEPVSAGFFGYFFAAEAFDTNQFIGAFLIIFGMLSAEIGSYIRSKYVIDK